MKTPTMTSIDSELKKKAKAMGLNISELTEDALRRRIKPSIKDLPVEKLITHCDVCGEECRSYFLCESSGKVYCLQCESNRGKMCAWATKEELLTGHCHILNGEEKERRFGNAH